VNAGKNVTTHTDKVSIPGGWSGFGYIITDPVLGDGVYKISGGLNGGLLKENIDTISDLISNISEGIIEKYGAVFSKFLVRLKGIIDKINTFVSLLSTCPPMIAMAGILSLIVITSGFARLAAVSGKIPYVGILVASGVALGGLYVTEKVADGFIQACRAK